MDKKVHDESSNSQNDNLEILRIVSRGANASAFRVELSNGSSFSISADFLLAHKLKKSLSVDGLLLSEFQKEDKFFEAREILSSALAKRDFSAGELELRLRKKSILPEIAKEVILDFESRGLINEYRYASNLLRYRIKIKPSSAVEYKKFLFTHFISDKTANKVIEEQLDGAQQESDLYAACEKLLRTSRTKALDANKFRATLLRRGFSSKIVSAAVKKYFSSSEDSED